MTSSLFIALISSFGLAVFFALFIVIGGPDSGLKFFEGVICEADQEIVRKYVNKPYHQPGEVSVEIYCQDSTGQLGDERELKAIGYVFALLWIGFLPVLFVITLAIRTVRANSKISGLEGLQDNPSLPKELRSLLQKGGAEVTSQTSDGAVINLQNVELKDLSQLLGALGMGQTANGSTAVEEALSQLKSLMDKGLISGEDYEKKKAELLKTMFPGF